jgi:hypothetical protein
MLEKIKRPTAFLGVNEEISLNDDRNKALFSESVRVYTIFNGNLIRIKNIFYKIF